MAGQAKTTSQLTVRHGVDANARFVMVNNTAGTAETVTITGQDYFGNTFGLPCEIISAPANSTALNITGGSLYTDGTYLYIATANNTLKKPQANLSTGVITLVSF